MFKASFLAGTKIDTLGSPPADIRTFRKRGTTARFNASCTTAKSRAPVTKTCNAVRAACIKTRRRLLLEPRQKPYYWFFRLFRGRRGCISTCKL
jgi:hypothetical protein